MPGGVIGINLNYGFEGTLSRSKDEVIEAHKVSSASANIPFGAPVILNGNNTIALGDSTLTATNFGGIAMAEIKQGITYTTNGTLTQNGQYAPYQVIDVIKRGVVSKKCAFGAPTAGGTVYYRTAVNSGGSYPNSVVGDLGAATDTGAIALTGVVWNTGYVDANGITELKLKTINN